MYQFKEDIDDTRYFRFDKKVIEDKNWALLPLASKSIYPVIGYHRNRQNGESFPSQQTMAILSGRDFKTVRKGQKGLGEFPGIKADAYISRRGKRGTKYFWTEPPHEKGRIFQFHDYIIDSGIWSQLTETAQALYPVMRYYCYLNWEDYVDIFPTYYEKEFRKPFKDEDFTIQHDGIEDFEVGTNFDAFFPSRYYEFCEADKDVLAEYAGISKNSLYNALRNLEKNHLVYRLDGYPGWLVIVRPQTYFKRDFLNEQIKRRFGPGE
jgi:hypothetical protein